MKGSHGPCDECGEEDVLVDGVCQPCAENLEDEAAGRELERHEAEQYADGVGPEMVDHYDGMIWRRPTASSGPWGTAYDFEQSRLIAANDPTFYSILYALIRKADSDNARRIESAWPGIIAEARERYNAPGARLEGEEG